MLPAHWIRNTLLASALCVICSVSSAATSIVIVYEASDLPDLVVGEDLWQYAYTVSGSFAQGFGFEILFDAQKVASLEASPAAPNLDWFVSTVQPLAGVPSDGIYAVQSLVPGASLVSPFQVSFVWNGLGPPGAQTFNVLDDTFGLVESGITAAIPEPHVYGLMGAGLLMLIGRLCTRRTR